MISLFKLFYKNSEIGLIGKDVQPPSTSIDEPVIIDEALEARKTTAVATSFTVAKRPKGILLSIVFINFLSLKNFFSIGVLTNVGHTVFTRIFSLAKSMAIPFVRPSIPNFVILYTVRLGAPT